MGQYWSKTIVVEPTGTATVTTPYYIEANSVATVTANDGYLIQSIHLLADTGEETYVEEAVGKQEHSFVVRSELPGIYATNKVTITVVTESAGAVISYTETLDTVTSDFTSSSVKETDVITYTTVGQSRFSGDISVTFVRGGVESTEVFNITDNPTLFDTDNTVFTLTLADYWSEDLESVSVTATAEPYVTYSENLTKVSSNIPGTEVEENDVLILTADSGNSFQYISSEDSDIEVTKVVNGNSTTTPYNPNWEEEYFSENDTVFTLPLSEIWEPGITRVSVYAKAFEMPMPTEVTVYQEYVNVTSSLGAGDSEGTVYNVPLDTVVTLTAIDGHEFQDGIQISWLSKFGNPPNRQTYHPTSESDAHYFNEDKTVFTISLDEHANYDTGFVSINAIAKQKYLGDDTIEGRTTAFANIYYADDSVLSNIVSDRWFNTGSSYIDFGEYIYAVYKYPIKIDQAEFVSTDPIAIQLGRHTGATQSRYFLRSRVAFDLGTIAVPEEYNNVYDYRDVTCLLHLPYANPIEIDYTYVIGSGIQLLYLLDLYNGTTTLEVYSDKIEGGLVLRQDIEIAYEIPFMKLAYNEVKGKIGRYISNRVQTPYVEVIRPIPYDTESEQGKEGKEVGKLSEFTGYVEVRDVKLEGAITEQEREKIINLLTNGVYINELTPPSAP